MNTIYYSAKEAAEIINSSPEYNISVRTINYYAFDKKMFETNGKSKKSFGSNELDKLRSILLLKKYTKFNLDEIKEIISKFALLDIEKRFINIATYNDVESFSSSSVTSYSSVNTSDLTMNLTGATTDGIDITGVYVGDVIPNPTYIGDPIPDNDIWVNQDRLTIVEEYPETVKTLDPFVQAMRSLDDKMKKDVDKTIKISDNLTIIASGKIDQQKLSKIIEMIKIIEK